MKYCRVLLLFPLLAWTLLPIAAFAQSAFTYRPERALDSLTEDGLAREVRWLPLAPDESVTLRYVLGESQPMPTHLSAPWYASNGRYPEQPVVLGPVVQSRGQRFQLIYHYGGQLTDARECQAYAWVEYDLAYHRTATAQVAQRSSQPVSASVLANGDWYQIAVEASGVYRIDANLLQALGLSPSALDPRHLQLYGTSTGLLPQANVSPRPEDLQPVALQLVGGNDGRWDTGDHALFYAQGPHAWRFLASDARLFHEQHLYSDRTYYYLAVDRGTNTALLPTEEVLVGSFPEGALWAPVYIEQDVVNLTLSGRQWFDGPLNPGTTAYSVRFPSEEVPAATTLRLRYAARAGSTSSFAITAQGNSLGIFTLSSVDLESTINDYARQREDYFASVAAPVAGNLEVTIDFSPGSTGTGWLDWIEAHARYQRLAPAQGGSFFALPEDGGMRQLDAQLAELWVWDVTNPLTPRQLTLPEGVLTYASDTLRHFYCFRSEDAPTPVAVGRVANQNLHGLPQADLLIVTAPPFLEAATRLADHHRSFDGLGVHVVTDAQVFHEFSGGAPDATAIRDFVRMFYCRAAGGDGPKYLQLIGDASYDNLGRTAFPSTLISYQSRHSLRRLSSYISDDYFGFLDEEEGFWGESSFIYPEDTRTDLHFLDIGVGRLPVANVVDADAMVDKIIRYASSDAVTGDWQSRVLIMGDYRENEYQLHTSQADELADTLSAQNPCLAVDKLYLDQYPAEFSGSRTFFPEARAEALQQLERGVLLVNYNGHGSEITLSNSTLFSNSDAAALNNPDRPAFWVSATCEFGRHDNPELLSGVETLLLHPTGGAIGALTSVRLVYSSPNFLLNRNWHRFSVGLDPETGRYRALGDVFRLAKNETYPSGLAVINTRNFALLGDPALRLKIPDDRIVLTQVNGNTPGAKPDTLKALQQVVLRGEVQAPDGSLRTSFNGALDVVLFDKAQNFTTLLDEFSYQEYRSVLFNGTVTVTAGEFQVSFVLPLDIDYVPGLGNLVLFASGSGTQAFGCWQQATICCTDPDGMGDDTPPSVLLYLGDTLWVPGGSVDPDPLFIARIADNLGINPSGQGIGRELLATLDENSAEALNLGSFFQSDPNDPTRGTLTYQYQNLSPGLHTLSLRAWDVANNSTLAQTEFIVIGEDGLQLVDVLPYPNPYNPTAGPLQLRVNQTGGVGPLSLRIVALSPEGREIVLLLGSVTPEGYITLLEWHANEDLGAGVYTLRCILTDPETGAAEELYRKLIVHP